MMRATEMLKKGVFLSVWSRGKATLLTVMVALTLATVTPAFAANGGNLILGSLNNTATAITRLVGNVNGPALYIVNPNTGASATGALFQVASGHPPFTVNPQAGKATNLDADKLDGKDSTALGVTTKTNHAQTGTCAAVGVFSPCAPVTVNVPAGKQYDVTVLSSLNALGNTSAYLYYCPAIQGGSFGLSCLTPSPQTGFADQIYLTAAYPQSAASSGEIGPLSAGTYTFSTTIKSNTTLFNSGNQQAHTTVLVRDVSAPGPPIS